MLSLFVCGYESDDECLANAVHMTDIQNLCRDILRETSEAAIVQGVVSNSSQFKSV